MNRLEVEKVALAGGDCRSEDAVVEVPVLLESELLSVLASAACAHGMSAGTLVRRLIRDFLYCAESDLPTPCTATDGGKGAEKLSSF